MQIQSYRLFLLPFIFVLCSLQAAQPTIYVQASQGSFNHQAIEQLLQESITEYHIQFCGTPENTIRHATLNNGLAFCALHNTIIPGNYVHPTIRALQTYRIAQLYHTHTMKIEMALLRHCDAALHPLTHIASHPAALKQIILWKQQHPLTEIPIPDGTAEAARMLSEGQLHLGTAVIGAKTLIHLYPNLTVLAEGIQDTEDNYTTFILLKPVKRETPASPAEVMEEVSQLLGERTCLLSQ